MATEAQILANRLNAQKSTGPRTAAGKAIVSQNAVKHGLSGQETVVAGEEPGEFEFYRERMIGELGPVGEVEAELAERIVSLSWRLKRAERLQAVAFDSLLARQTHDLCEKFDNTRDADGDSTFGRAIVRDFSNGRVLDRLLMYERRIEHSLYRTMAELKRHRLLQEVQANGVVALRRALARDEDAGAQDHGRDARATVPADNTTSDEGRATRPPAATLHGASRKTKPIWPPLDPGQAPCEKGLTTDSLRDKPSGTKPMRGEDRDGDRLLRTANLPCQACLPLRAGAGGL